MRCELSFRSRAVAQGVSRPFDVLVQMHPRDRRRVAKLLGCTLGKRVDPSAEAWRIINQNLCGLQARTHTLPEQLTPFSRNNNWWEIVTRTARGYGVKFYPGLDETEVERLVFERFAERFLAVDPPAESGAVDSLATVHPNLQHAFMSLQLSKNATRTVLWGLVLTMSKADEGLRDGCIKVSEWVRASVRWSSWAISIASGLRLLKQALSDIYDSWTSRRRVGSNVGKVAAAVSMIYFQDLLDRTLEEFETAGA